MLRENGEAAQRNCPSERSERLKRFVIPSTTLHTSLSRTLCPLRFRALPWY